MPIAIYALALSMFAIGTTELVVVGLLPTISTQFDVSISTTGLLVTAYALGIAVGGPLVLTLTARVPRKRLLLILMALFIVGNLACGLAPTFVFLLVARVLTAFVHAAFVGAGVVVAIKLVDEERQGRAMARMFGGLTIALAVGVPLGTFVGQHIDWRATFYGAAAVGAIALALDARFLPEAEPAPRASFRAQLGPVRDPRVLLVLLITIVGFGGQMVAYTYVAPFLEDVSGFAPSSITALLVVFGVAAALGTFLAGAAVDRGPVATPPIMIALLAGVLAVMTLTGETQTGAVITLAAWGALAFGLGPVLQHQATRAAPHSPEIVSSLNISAFNLGIAGGAFIGGRVVAGLGIHAVVWVAALIVALAAVLALLAALRGTTRTRTAREAR
jgi:DHA1 family inner membrane transport protein